MDTEKFDARSNFGVISHFNSVDSTSGADYDSSSDSNFSIDSSSDADADADADSACAVISQRRPGKSSIYKFTCSSFPNTNALATASLTFNACVRDRVRTSIRINNDIDGLFGYGVVLRGPVYRVRHTSTPAETVKRLIAHHAATCLFRIYVKLVSAVRRHYFGSLNQNTYPGVEFDRRSRAARESACSRVFAAPRLDRRVKDTREDLHAATRATRTLMLNKASELVDARVASCPHDAHSKKRERHVAFPPEMGRSTPRPANAIRTGGWGGMTSLHRRRRHERERERRAPEPESDDEGDGGGDGEGDDEGDGEGDGESECDGDGAFKPPEPEIRPRNLKRPRDQRTSLDVVPADNRGARDGRDVKSAPEPETTECFLCMERQSDVWFPCGLHASCETCVRACWRSTPPKPTGKISCPFCRRLGPVESLKYKRSGKPLKLPLYRLRLRRVVNYVEDVEDDDADLARSDTRLGNHFATPLTLVDDDD